MSSRYLDITAISDDGVVYYIDCWLNFISEFRDIRSSDDRLDDWGGYRQGHSLIFESAEQKLAFLLRWS